MADWIRARKNWFRTNNKWVAKAFESAKANNSNWATYYGKYGHISNSWGLNPDNPFYNPTRKIDNYYASRDSDGQGLGFPRNDGCDECNILAEIINCSDGNNDSAAMKALRSALGNRVCECNGTQNEKCCGCISNNCQGADVNCIPVSPPDCPDNSSIADLCAARVNAGSNWDPCAAGSCECGFCLNGCPCCEYGAADCSGDVGDGCLDGPNGESGCLPLECTGEDCATIGMAEYGLVCNGCQEGQEVVGENGESLGECLCEDITAPGCTTVACPCGVIPGSCYFGPECISPCCPPGEEGCCECPDGSWVPCESGCGSSECTCPNYGGGTLPLEYCMTCEYCDCVCDDCDCSNFSGEGGFGMQCLNPQSCLWCEITGKWIDPSIEDCDEPPTPCNCDSQGPCATDSECPEGTVCIQGGCHDPECVYCECTERCQPIWWDCDCEVNPCEDPTDPECFGGPPIVCYDYNSNDPIYYSASSLGPSVTVEYTTTDTATGGTYSYGSVALLCEVPDQFQLCVYVEDSSGNETQLAYANCGDFSESGCTTNNSFIINQTASTITLSPTTSVPGGGKVVMRRCTDNNRMMLSFSDGAKLTANDLNASLHQLLFLIQEKEFASNTYYNVANAADISATSFFEVKSDSPATLSGKSIQLIASDGTTRQYVFFNTTGQGHDTGDVGAATNDVIVQVYGLSTTATIAAQLEAAIESAAGHNSKILVNDYTGNTSKRTLTQSVVGTAGNTAITTTGIDDTIVIIPSIFTGGTDYGGSALIKFAPATTLPVTFNFAGASSGEVLIWDGNEVSATATPPKSTLLGLVDVDDTVTAVTNDVLTYSGGKWKPLAAQGTGGTGVDLTAFLVMDYSANAALDDFWTATSTSSGLGSEVSTVWEKSHISTWVSNARGGSFTASQEKATIPNAITAFGLGMFGAQEWTRNALGVGDGVASSQIFDTWYDGKSPPGSNTVHAAMEWDLSKGVGRKWASESPEPVTNSSPYWGINDVLRLSTSLTTCGRAFYESISVSGVDRKIKRVELYNIDQSGGFELYSEKCSTTGIQFHKKNASNNTMSGQPEVDHYFNSLKNAVSLANWTTGNNWGRTHPLAGVSGGLDYTAGIKEAFQSDYVYSSLEAGADLSGGTYNADQTTAGWWKAQLNMPAVITYYLGTLYDADLAAGNSDNTTRTVPNVLEWKGNLESIVDPDLFFDDNIPNAEDGFYTTRQFLRSTRGTNERAGTEWYFHKWFIRADGATSEAGSSWVPEFNPFNGSHYQDGGGSDNTYIRPSYKDGTDQGGTLSFNAGYSFMIESNKVFSWFIENTPPMYDDYVFKVTMKDQLPANASYQVMIDLHEHVNGCSQLESEGVTTASKRVGDTDCDPIGIGGTNIASDGTERSGQHIYPADFHPEYVSIWNQVDFTKIKAYSRNHQPTSFEIVLKIPRFVRIGVIDRYTDPNDESYYNSSGAGTEVGPLSLELMADGYTSTDWSDDTDGSGDGNPPNNNSKGITQAGSDTASGLIVPNTIASVSTESAIQYIRLGIPANMMLRFAVIPSALSPMTEPT